MVLAGVLLKLGVYGFLRFSPFILFYLRLLKGLLFSLGLVGGLYRCFLCLRQSDLKSFVAYSSVCHIGFGLGGLYRGNFLGYSGSVFIIISHGFCSSCLFYILYVIYERFFTRRGLLMKGIGFVFPLISLVLFVFSVLNMGVPPSFSFFSEVLILVGVSGLSFLRVIFSGLLLLFSGLYGIFFYVISCHRCSVLNG
jgi:NADH:ubiquinone oxidoreductase subunit 4 (subunit M)